MKICVKCLILLLIAVVSYASAGSLFDEKPLLNEVYAEYPKEGYIVGIGIKNKTDKTDRRVAEVLARLEIARQIKVRVKEATLDIACEGTIGKIYNNALECRNEFIMIIEQSVDEVLVGSRIVIHGEKDGIVYAVAVLKRKTAIEALDEKTREALDKTQDSIKKARHGDKDSLKKAEEEYMKAVTYDKEREIIEGVKSRASEVFEELEKEIVKLHGTSK